jgi:hypothetical protein
MTKSEGKTCREGAKKKESLEIRVRVSVRMILVCNRQGFLRPPSLLRGKSFSDFGIRI